MAKGARKGKLPMRHAILIICVGFLHSSAALAAPQDFQDKLPPDVLGMTVKHAKESDGRLLVFYGETVGRATVTIAPALEADTIKSPSITGMGVTPSAQRSLMQAIDQNLAGAHRPKATWLRGKNRCFCWTVSALRK